MCRTRDSYLTRAASCRVVMALGVQGGPVTVTGSGIMTL